MVISLSQTRGKYLSLREPRHQGTGLPALEEDLVRDGLTGETLPGKGAVELAVPDLHQGVDQAVGSQAGGEL